MMKPASFFVVLLIVISGAASAVAQDRPRVTKDDLLSLYDLSNPQVNLDELIAPGVPQDGIPPLTDPKFELAADADFPPDDARVAVVTDGDEALAYPLLILNFHEIVNHTVGQRPIAVLYCPLCDSVSVVDRTLAVSGDDGDPEAQLTLEFGVSGFLLNSNVVMYDRQTKGLWSQVFAQAITGPHAGATLRHLPFQMMTFAEFREHNPEGSVLSRETGHERPYHLNRFERYIESDRIYGEFEFGDALPPKTLGMGVRVGEFVAFVTQRHASDTQVTLQTPKGDVVLEADESGFTIIEAPEQVQTVQTFYHSWSAFFPETNVITHDSESDPASEAK